MYAFANLHHDAPMAQMLVEGEPPPAKIERDVIAAALLDREGRRWPDRIGWVVGHVVDDVRDTRVRNGENICGKPVSSGPIEPRHRSGCVNAWRANQVHGESPWDTGLATDRVDRRPMPAHQAGIIDRHPRSARQWRAERLGVGVGDRNDPALHLDRRSGLIVKDLHCELMRDGHRRCCAPKLDPEKRDRPLAGCDDLGVWHVPWCAGPL